MTEDLEAHEKERREDLKNHILFHSITFRAKLMTLKKHYIPLADTYLKMITNSNKELVKEIDLLEERLTNFESLVEERAEDISVDFDLIGLQQQSYEQKQDLERVLKHYDEVLTAINVVNQIFNEYKETYENIKKDFPGNKEIYTKIEG